MKRSVVRLVVASLAMSMLGLVGLEDTASAQEIQVSGPLAGAASVRKQRLYRKGRFEIAPSVSFTLLDEYQRTIMVGGRLTYNFTDWLALGVWGSFAPPPLKLNTGLTDEIQQVNESRQGRFDAAQGADLEHRLTAVNMGKDFAKQLSSIDWIAAPQLTLVPLRGKIGLFESIYVDTDLYIFGGAGFVGLTERSDCETDKGLDTVEASRVRCAPQGAPGSVDFPTASRMAIAPTFGLGLSFYVSRWGSLSAEYRALPFSRNLGGFDNHGGGPNEEFPDLNVDEKDREFRFNQMITIAFGIALPFDYQVSE